MLLRSTGKRKTAIACLQYSPLKIKNNTINGKDFNIYFSQERLRLKILSPFKVAEIEPFFFKFKIIGGGVNAQAEAARHAISKLIKIIHKEDSLLIKKLKDKGFFTRNSKIVERKKPGQRKARAKFNWQKR